MGRTFQAQGNNMPKTLRLEISVLSKNLVNAQVPGA
jgi:hypothetical protein